jgi:hypothetical protein
LSDFAQEFSPSYRHRRHSLHCAYFWRAGAQTDRVEDFSS